MQIKELRFVPPDLCIAYFLIVEAQFSTTVMGVWLACSTVELTRNRCPSPETAYRFGDVNEETCVWNNGSGVPISIVEPDLMLTA